MDDSAIRAGKLAGLFLLAAGMSGCVAVSFTGKPRRSDFSAASTAGQCPASAFDASKRQNVVLAAAAGNPDPVGTLVLEVPEIPIADPFKPARIEVPFELEPVVNVEPSGLRHAVGHDVTARELDAHVGGDISETEIPELPGAAGTPAATDAAPGKVYVRSGRNFGGVEKVKAREGNAADGDASADDAPGRAFVCDNAEPEVVYQELAVAVPAERWPSYSSGSRAVGLRRNVFKRHAASPGSSSPGIVRYVDPAQGLAQVVFAGMTVVQPGSRIAVRHQLLFGRLASTEFLEVVSSEPGVAIVRPFGNGRITKIAIGDPVDVINQ